jgi:hypothetical protein
VSGRRFLTLLCALGTLSLTYPQAALAADGLGFAGRVSDKTITLFCFGVIIFFPLLVTVLSLVQDRLERRHERRRYDLERLG